MLELVWNVGINNEKLILFLFINVNEFYFFLNLNRNENFYNYKNDQILYFEFFFFSILLHGIMINISFCSCFRWHLCFWLNRKS